MLLACVFMGSWYYLAKYLFVPACNCHNIYIKISRKSAFQHGSSLHSFLVKGAQSQHKQTIYSTENYDKVVSCMYRAFKKIGPCFISLYLWQFITVWTGNTLMICCKLSLSSDMLVKA